MTSFLAKMTIFVFTGFIAAVDARITMLQNRKTVENCMI